MEAEAKNDASTSSTSPLTALSSTAIQSMSYPTLMERKEEVTARLAVIGTKPKKKSAPTTHFPLIPYTPKSDTHWDFMMKEMAWLGADFAAERKRQLASGKKLASAVRQFHKTKETRRARELAEAELKRRRLAGKISREVRGWWTKVERVIAYKQKVSADVERRKAMNKQLVALVHQTEKYGESLACSTSNTMDEYDSQEEDNCRRQKRRLTIEEALREGSNEPSIRRTSKMDYARLHKEEDTDEFYGTTTSESGSDGSFHLEGEHSTDDESTFLEAEARELAERRAREESDDEDDASYYADPDELQKLKEEAEMDVTDVVERFRQEAVVVPDVDVPMQVDSPNIATRRVRFAGNTEQSSNEGDEAAAANGEEEVLIPSAARATRHRAPETDPGNEADDDADISDVEDFVEEEDGNVSGGSDEFEADHEEKDDETTIEAEERMGRDMSASDEINLLQQEGEMSVEELRKMYPSMDNDNDPGQEEEEDQSDSSEPIADDTAEQDEFQPDAMEVDDETTLEAEERLGREISHEQEMALLDKEGEIPIEQLRAMYADMAKDSGDDEMSIEAEPQSQVSETDDQSLRDMLDHGGSDEDGGDFRPDELSAVDDETTMEAEERLGRDMSYQDEIHLLKRESEMSVEELRLMYAGTENSGQDDQSLDESIFDEDDQESENEFRPATEAVDDETTMEEEERLGQEMSVEEEIALLQKEGETPVEHLKAVYNQMEEDEGDTNDDQRRRQGRKRSRQESDGEDDGEAALEALKVAEEKARMTFATRPFLIAPWVKLREYQQIGLNWLVSIQTRRLNAILADEMVSMIRSVACHFTCHRLLTLLSNRAWERRFKQLLFLRTSRRTRVSGAHISLLFLHHASSTGRLSSSGLPRD